MKYKKTPCFSVDSSTLVISYVWVYLCTLLCRLSVWWSQKDISFTMNLFRWNLHFPGKGNDNTDTNKLLCSHLIKGWYMVHLSIYHCGRVSKYMLNRNMLERPNTSYIFEKMGVQGCQIWHSHVSFGHSPFNSSPQCKISSLRYHFSQNSWKLGSQKLLHQGHFWWRSKFFSFSLPSGPRGMFEPNSDK